MDLVQSEPNDRVGTPSLGLGGVGMFLLPKDLSRRPGLSRPMKSRSHLGPMVVPILVYR